MIEAAEEVGSGAHDTRARAICREWVFLPAGADETSLADADRVQD